MFAPLAAHPRLIFHDVRFLDVHMASPPPPPAPSAGLLATDGAVLMLYSFSASIAGLFTSGEFLEPSLMVTSQDLVDLVVAFDSAGALALGWCLASIVTNVCAQEWLELPPDAHTGSVLGVKGVLQNWLLGFPLGLALRAMALLAMSTGGWATTNELPPLDAAALVESAGVDGAGTLLALTLWRRWLLAWFGVL